MANRGFYGFSYKSPIPDPSLVNGGFESGVITPWSSSGVRAIITDGGTGVHSGKCGMLFWYSRNGNYISQTVEGLYPGSSYAVSVWTEALSGDQSTLVTVKFNGTTLGTVGGTTWTLGSWVVLSTVTSAILRIEAPNTNRNVYLDDISVMALANI